jgi:uncharacterized protein YhaN
LQRLAALPTQLQPGLEVLSGIERRRIQALAEEEAKAAMENAARLMKVQESLLEQIDAARVLREAAIARYQASSERRMRGPKLAVEGAQAPLGRLAQDSLLEAIQQVHDRVLVQELAQDAEADTWWPLKDDLDQLEERAKVLENAPLSQGWQAMVKVLEELERVYWTATAGPSSSD